MTILRLFPLRIALLCLASGLLASGCASTFPRETAMARLGELRPDRTGITSESPFQNPVKLAVYLDMETIDSSGNFSEKWEWSHQDEQQFVPFLNQLAKKRITSEYFFLPANSIRPDDIDAIFKQAEKNGAEAVLCIRGITFVDGYCNPAAILDLTVLGLFCWIPGSNRDALVLVRGDYWDVANRKLAFSIWSEGSKRTVGPTLWINSEYAFAQAKRRSIRNFMRDLNKEIHPSFDIKLIK